VVIPANQESVDLQKMCAHHAVSLIRMEQGFFALARGTDTLSALLKMPPSKVFDSLGRYEDPSRPSFLENQLGHAVFSGSLLKRARGLREYFVQSGFVLKNYIIAGNGSPLPDIAGKAQGRRILLVPGQREDESSVQLGGTGMASDRDLLQAVRQENPEAFIVYLLPHGGLANGGNGELSFNADETLHDVDIVQLFSHVHEVHTLTSLSGLDALLRHIPVYTYGGPFYAGWGLTTDRLAFSRRSRPLTLDMLVAGTLIVCPSYYDWRTRMFCGPEDICRLQRLGISPKSRLPLAVRLQLLRRNFFPGK
jgi:capsular polysaccharide export protein